MDMRKTNNPVGHRTKQNSPEMKLQWLRDTEGNVQHPQSSVQTQTALRFHLTSVRMAKITIKQTAHAGERTDLCSHYGNQCGGSAQSWEYLYFKISYIILRHILKGLHTLL